MKKSMDNPEPDPVPTTPLGIAMAAYKENIERKILPGVYGEPEPSAYEMKQHRIEEEKKFKLETTKALAIEAKK